MPPPSGRKIFVYDVIAQAKIYGCEYRVSNLMLVTPEGNFQIKYLVKVSSRERFNMSEFEIDEYMLETDISALERRLKIILR